MPTKLYSCFRCKRKLPAESFYPNSRRSTGLTSDCRKCHLIAGRAAKKVAPEVRKYRSYRNLEPSQRTRAYKLWANYRITVEDYDAMLRKQKGRCAICKGKPNGQGKENGFYHVDHDPETMKVRGLLCGNCNHAIGKLKHDPAIARNAVRYLERSLR